MPHGQARERPRRPGADALPRLRLIPALAAAAGGLTLWISHPPVAAWPATFLTVPLLLAALWLEQRATQESDDRPRYALLGGIAGLTAYGPMLTWLILPAGVLGWGLLVLLMAAWMALFAYVVSKFLGSSWIVLVAPVAWLAMDAWRGVVPLGGFGWGEIGYAHAHGSWMLPLARLLGVHAITLLTVLIGTLLFDAGRRAAQAIESSDGPRQDRLERGVHASQPALLGLAGALLVSVVATVQPPAPSGEVVDVLAVQGNDLRHWAEPGPRNEDRAIAKRMLGQTREAVREGGSPELTVWPESSVDRDPFSERGAELLPLVEQAAQLVEGDLLLGTNLDGPRPGTFLNAIVQVSETGEPVEAYVKRHLVPFGEYVPWRSVLGDFPPLRQVPRDAVPGEGPQRITAADAHLAVGICFESMFAPLMRDSVIAGDEPAELVIIATNDASFGEGSESAQHVDQSRLRAVETGRWVVHSALSGASAFIDPQGRVHDITDLFTQTWIRDELPLVRELTPYLVLGDLIGTGARILGVGLLGWVLLERFRRRQPAPTSQETDS